MLGKTKGREPQMPEFFWLYYQTNGWLLNQWLAGYSVIWFWFWWLIIVKKIWGFFISVFKKNGLLFSFVSWSRHPVASSSAYEFPIFLSVKTSGIPVNTVSLRTFCPVCVWCGESGEDLKGCKTLLVILYNDHRVHSLGKTASSSCSFAYNFGNPVYLLTVTSAVQKQYYNHLNLYEN